MTSSLTTALEEMNKKLRREVDVLKTDVTQLRTNNDAMKDENKQLKTEVDMMKAEIVQLKIENNDLRARHVDTSRSLHPPPVPQRRNQLKVSQWSGSHELFTYTIPTTHTLITQ